MLARTTTWTWMPWSARLLRERGPCCPCISTDGSVTWSASTRLPESTTYWSSKTPRRDELRACLKSDGIETLVSWPNPMWHHRALKLGEYHLPETEAICREVVSLPMSAETTDQHVEETVACIRRFFGR